jgi:uncharacterized protein
MITAVACALRKRDVSRASHARKRGRDLRRALCSGLAVVALALFVGPFSSLASAADLVIGTGSTAGVYFQAGRAICSLVNRQNAELKLTCQALPTKGSIANLQDLRDGKLQIALAQSDWQFHAVKGTGPFSSAGPDGKLRSLFSLYAEPFTVVARRDSGIATFKDLKGKRVNIGNPGSGQRATMEVVMAAMGWTADDFALADSLPADQQSLALCHDRVQAIVYTVGHPNPSIGKAIGLCDARIVDVSGPAIDKLVADNPYYAYTEIPGGIYSGNDEPVKTFGVTATVVASADLDADTAYAVVKTVFDNLDRFRGMHPAFGALEAKHMISDGLTAPLHEGAVRYYKEKGLM